MANDYMNRSLRELEANSGQNLYNRMVKRGARRAGLNRERAYQAADDLLGADPSVLQPTLLQINEQAGRDFQGVEENADLASAETARDLAKFRYDVGLQQDALRDARKQRDLETAVAIGGGLLTAGTGLYGAKIAADAVSQIANNNPAGLSKPQLTPPAPKLVNVPQDRVALSPATLPETVDLPNRMRSPLSLGVAPEVGMVDYPEAPELGVNPYPETVDLRRRRLGQLKATRPWYDNPNW